MKQEAAFWYLAFEISFANAKEYESIAIKVPKNPFWNKKEKKKNNLPK